MSSVPGPATSSRSVSGCTPLSDRLISTWFSQVDCIRSITNSSIFMARSYTARRRPAYATVSMLNDVNAVLFDLDGTLVNTIPLIFACYEHTLGVHVPGFQPTRRVIVGNLGRSLDDILYDYAVAAGVSDAGQVAREMLHTYRS